MNNKQGIRMMRTGWFVLALAVGLLGCEEDGGDGDGMGGAGGTGGVAVDMGGGAGGMGAGGMGAGGMGAGGMGAGGMGAGGMGGPSPLGPDSPPALGVQIDRIGRPAISTALQATFDGDSARKGTAKDAYNAAAPAEWANFKSGFEGSLAILDSLDTNCGNQLLAGADAMPGRYAGLAGVLADDRLYVHSGRRECSKYLGLEAEVVGAVEPGTGSCGGRILEADIIARSYSVLAAGMLTGVDDGIIENDVPFLADFPYLAGAH